jgi:hypothetical protein
MKWTRHAAPMGKVRNTHTILLENLEDHFENLWLAGTLIIKWTLKK